MHEVQDCSLYACVFVHVFVLVLYIDVHSYAGAERESIHGSKSKQERKKEKSKKGITDSRELWKKSSSEMFLSAVERGLKVWMQRASSMWRRRTSSFCFKSLKERSGVAFGCVSA